MNKNELISFAIGGFCGFFLLSMYFSDKGLIDFVGLMVAALALGLTVKTSKDTKKHNKLSVLPFIGNMTYTGPNYFIFEIKNRGLGPAKIESITIYIEQTKVTMEQFESDINALVKQLTLGLYSVNTVKLGEGEFIEKAEKHNIIDVKCGNGISDELIDTIKNRYTLEINYHSLYGEEKFYTSASKS